jgi:hypothetical protein
MKLEIRDPKNLLDRSFIEWLKLKIRDKILIDTDPHKLLKWDLFFNDNNEFKSIYKKRIQTRDFIIAGAVNLTYTKSEVSFIIRINNNIYTPGLDRIKLISICKLINFGNSEIGGYPIFTNTMNHFAENIQYYVEEYTKSRF